MDSLISLNDHGTLLLAIGVGAVVGVLFGGWVMTTLHKLLMALVKLVLLGGAVLIGVFLWREYQGSHPSEYSPSKSAYSPPAAPPQLIESTYHDPPPSQPPGSRWWDKKKQE